MKRALYLAMIGGFLLALPGSATLWSKAHVPLDKVQVCYKDKVRTVSAKSLERFLRKDACRLPACDFDQVFFQGNDCSGVAGDVLNNTTMATGSDGFCDGVIFPLTAPANGKTARCTNPF